MRKASLFLTTMVTAALLLAACGGEETSTSIPSTNVPPITVEVTGTSDMGGTETETPAATDTMTTTTPAVPVTGGDSLSRVTNLIGAPVCGMGGDELGTVQDLVLDFDQTMVSYVIVDASGRNIAVPWTSFDMMAAGGTGTGAGTDTGSTPAADATAASPDPNATATSGAGTGTGTGTDVTAQQDCLAVTVDDDTLNNAPDFDQSTLPAQGQPAAGWDTDISGYWSNPGAGGTGGAVAQSTDTPSAGGATSATAVPTTTASGSTGTGTGTGTGTTQGQGAMQMQGVILATDVLGATVMVSPQGNDQGTGTTDTGSTPAADATAASPDPNATATSGAGTGTGTGTDLGDMSTGTVEDIIIEPDAGDMRYLVVSFGTQDRWIPIPVGFLRWDATTNGFVLMINQNALQNAPAFSADAFPDTSAEGWDQEWETFWQNNGGTGTGGTGTGTGGTTISTATATP